jgi:hypothetical protein
MRMQKITEGALGCGGALMLAAASPALAQSGALGAKQSASRSGPRIVSVVVDEGASTHRVNANGSPVTLLTSARAVVTLGNLTPGSTVEVMRGSMDLSVEQSRALAAIPVTTRCRTRFGGYREREPNASVLRAVASASGAATLDFSLQFALPDDGNAAGTNGPCSGPIAFRISPPAKKGVFPNRPLTSGGEVQFLMTPSFTIRPWTVYRYENTAQLGSIFNFTMKGEGASLCSGISPGPRSFPIGKHERGGDLAMQIRSGPAGTVCKAISPGVVLSDKVRLIAIDWAIEKDGTRCEAGDAAAARVGEQGVFQPGHLPENRPGLYMSASQIESRRRAGVPQPVPRANQHLMGFAHAWMWCDRTAVNDHGVRIVLRSATFEGPANAALPRP